MFDSIDRFLDPFLIAPFRALMNLTGSAEAAFVLGVFLLCALCTIIGELCMAGAYLFNRKRFAEVNQDMVRHNNLSIQAIAEKDKESFKACNKMANEAFGLTFFSGIALFASSIWPAFFALSWLEHRFSSSPLTVLGIELTYVAVFIPMYILTRVVFAKYLKRRIEPFKSIAARVDANEDSGEKMMRWSDLGPKENDAEGKDGAQSKG